MASLHVRNFPDALHLSLRQHARHRHQTVSEIVRSAIEREVAIMAAQEEQSTRPATRFADRMAELQGICREEGYDLKTNSRPLSRKGASIDDLLTVAGILDQESAREMEMAIESGCEGVDLDEWVPPRL
jgi:plasmid stability protein